MVPMIVIRLITGKGEQHDGLTPLEELEAQLEFMMDTDRQWAKSFAKYGMTHESIMAVFAKIVHQVNTCLRREQKNVLTA